MYARRSEVEGREWSTRQLDTDGLAGAEMTHAPVPPGRSDRSLEEQPGSPTEWREREEMLVARQEAGGDAARFQVARPKRSRASAGFSRPRAGVARPLPRDAA